MADTISIALFLVITILSVLIMVLGVQAFFILRELKKTINKANKVLEDTSVITESVSKPVSSFSSFADGIKMGVSILKTITGKSKHGKNE